MRIFRTNEHVLWLVALNYILLLNKSQRRFGTEWTKTNSIQPLKSMTKFQLIFQFPFSTLIKIHTTTHTNTNYLLFHATVQIQTATTWCLCIYFLIFLLRKILYIPKHCDATILFLNWQERRRKDSLVPSFVRQIASRCWCEFLISSRFH